MDDFELESRRGSVAYAKGSVSTPLTQDQALGFLRMASTQMAKGDEKELAYVNMLADGVEEMLKKYPYGNSYEITTVTKIAMMTLAIMGQVRNVHPDQFIQLFTECWNFLSQERLAVEDSTKAAKRN